MMDDEEVRKKKYSLVWHMTVL